MPTAEEAAAANALYRAMNGLPADSVNTQIMSTPAGQSYQAQINAADAAAEQAKHDVAFSQPRNDLAVTQSAAFNAINSAYQQQRSMSIGSGGQMSQTPGAIAEFSRQPGYVAAGSGGFTGNAATYQQTWQPLQQSALSRSMENQPSRSTVPTRDLSSGMNDVIFSSLPGAGTVTAFTPYGDKAQTELDKVKIGYSAPGEVGFYQQPYGHSILNLVSSGGRNALQSGMFTVNEPETPVVYTQESAGTKFSKFANIPEALKVISNPDYYSRLGAEVYGGYVRPLTGATVESTGAQLSTYENPNNLASLVSPGAVNLGKAALPGANIPWSVPSSAPAIATFDAIRYPAPFTSVGKSVVGADVPTEKVGANPIEVAATSLFSGKLPEVGALWASTPIAKIINNWSWESRPLEETAKNIAATTSRGTEGLLNTAAVLPLVGAETGGIRSAIGAISPLAKGTIVAGAGLGSSLLFGKATSGPSQPVGEEPTLDLKAVPIINFAAIPASYMGVNTKISANSEPGRFLSYGSGGIYKTADSVLGILPGNLSLAPASLAITVPSKTPLQQFEVGAPTVSVSGGSAELTALGNWLDANKGKVETKEQADYYNKYVSQYNDMAKANPTITTTTKNVVTVGSPDKVYKYGQWDIYSEKSGDVFRNLAGGYTPEQLNAYGETIKNKGLLENAIFGTGKFMSERPLDVLPSIAAGTVLYLGGEGIGAGLGMAAKGTGAVGSVARALTSPTMQTVAKYGVPLYFGGMMGWGVTEGLTATPQKIARNIGESAVPGVGMLWGAALPSILPSLRFGGVSRGSGAVGNEPTIGGGQSPVETGHPLSPREYALTSKLGENEITLPQFNRFMGIKTGATEATVNTGMSSGGKFLTGEVPRSGSHDYLSGKMNEAYGTTKPSFISDMTKQTAMERAQAKFIAGENLGGGAAKPVGVGSNLPTIGGGKVGSLLPDVPKGFERIAHVTRLTPEIEKGMVERGLSYNGYDILNTSNAVSGPSALFDSKGWLEASKVEFLHGVGGRSNQFGNYNKYGNDITFFDIPSGSVAKKITPNLGADYTQFTGPGTYVGKLTRNDLALDYIKKRYPNQGPNWNNYLTDTQVIFPGMKGGEHLKVGEAQLTEAEMNLYKNKVLYNFPYEQSAVTTPTGKVLDYGTSGKVTSTEPLSAEFYSKYNMATPFMKDGDEFFPNGKGEQKAKMSNDLRGSIMVHSHPAYKDAASSGEFPAGWGTSVPMKAINMMDANIGRTPSVGDIHVSTAYAPLQNVIINKYGATVMDFPPELRSAMKTTPMESNGVFDSINKMFEQHGKLSDKIRNRELSPVSNSKDYNALTYDEKINRAEMGNKIDMAGFAHYAADVGMGVRFVSDINPLTGIGRVHGFSPDVLELASKRKPVGGLYSPITGEKIYKGDRLVVRGSETPSANMISMRPTEGGFATTGEWGGMKLVPFETFSPKEYLGERNIPSMNPVYGNKANYNDFVGRWAAKNIKEVAPVAIPHEITNLGTAYDVRTTKAVVPAFGDISVSSERQLFNIGKYGEPKGSSSLELFKVNPDQYAAITGRSYIEGNGGVFGTTEVLKVSKEKHTYPGGQVRIFDIGKAAHVTSTSDVVINPLFDVGLTSEISPARISMAENILREPAKRLVKNTPKYTGQDLASSITDYTQMVQALDLTGVSRVLRAPESERLGITTGKSYELKFPGSSDINEYLRNPQMTKDALSRTLLNVGIGTETKVIGRETHVSKLTTAENLFTLGNGPNEKIGGLMFGDRQLAFGGMGDILKESTIPKDTLEIRKIKAGAKHKEATEYPYFLGGVTKKGLLKRSTPMTNLWKPKKTAPISTPEPKSGAVAIQKPVASVSEKLGSISHAIEGALSSSLPAQKSAYDLSPTSSFDASGMQGIGHKTKRVHVEEEEGFIHFPQVPGMQRPSKSSGIESERLFGETQRQGQTQKQRVEQERKNASKNRYGSLSKQISGSLSIMGAAQSTKSVQGQALRSANVQSFGLGQVQDQFKLPSFKIDNSIDIAQKIEPVTIRTLIPTVITDVGQVTGQRVGQTQEQKQGQKQEQKQTSNQIQKIEPKPEVPKPKFPVIPIIGLPGMPSFGGGTGSSQGRSGRKFRETMDYAFSVNASAKATKKLLQKGSNIGTGSVSLGSMGAPVKYKSAFNLPTIGLPKSLKLGSSAQKKKGKKK